jgi:sugar (pentulose or hexulose) kinase
MDDAWVFAATLARKAWVMLTGPKFVQPVLSVLLLLPYLEGERTPNIPDGTGVMLGINQKTFSASHYCRAAMEGVLPAAIQWRRTKGPFSPDYFTRLRQ